MKKQRALRIQTFLIIIFVLFSVEFVLAQKMQEDEEFIQALKLVKQNRQIDALPLLEKLVVRYPNEGELHAYLGVAVLANSASIKDADVRKKEVARAGEILKNAKKLGTENTLALHYLDLFENGFEIDSVSTSSSKEVEDAIREGEGYFGRGEYDKAFKEYERAYKIDSKNYDAALFAGDCFYAQKKYAESEIWFGRAIAINPKREQAHRFLGDALLFQDKIQQALGKFADAAIAEPGSKLSWERFYETAKQYGNRTATPFITTPSTRDADTFEILIEPKTLEIADGTSNWNLYTKIRNQQIANFNKIANGRKFVPTISEEVSALKSVALGVKTQLKSKKITKLDEGLKNLVEIDDLGMLDVYLVLFVKDLEYEEYDSFRDKNWERMKTFLVSYIAKI